MSIFNSLFGYLHGGLAANERVRKILVLEKCAIRLIVSVQFCEHVLPLASKWLFSELNKYFLCYTFC